MSQAMDMRADFARGTSPGAVKLWLALDLLDRTIEILDRERQELAAAQAEQARHILWQAIATSDRLLNRERSE